MPNTAQGTLTFLSHVIVTTMPMRQLCRIFSTTQMRKVAQNFFALCTTGTFLVVGMQLYPGVCKQNGGRGESGRTGSCLGSWDEQRQEGRKLGARQRGDRRSLSSTSLARGSSRWDDWARELSLPGVSTTLYQPSLPQKSLGRIPFLFSLTKKAVSITGRGKQSFHYNGHPSLNPPRTDETSALPKYLCFIRFPTKRPKQCFFSRRATHLRSSFSP